MLKSKSFKFSEPSEFFGRIKRKNVEIMPPAEKCRRCGKMHIFGQKKCDKVFGSPDFIKKIEREKQKDEIKIDQERSKIAELSRHFTVPESFQMSEYKRQLKHEKNERKNQLKAIESERKERLKEIEFDWKIEKNLRDVLLDIPSEKPKQVKE